MIGEATGGAGREARTVGDGVMWRGSVVSIWLAEGAGAPMRQVPLARAVAGRGLEGDRYFAGTGFYSWFTGPLREISLIEEEVLEALRRDHTLDLPAGAHRRNLVTRGVPLGHLVGRQFAVGGVRLRGVEISEPCKHLVDVTGISGVLSPLIHRGGLHAQILTDGEIAAGDPIAEEN